MKNLFSYLFGPNVNFLNNYRINKAIKYVKNNIPESTDNKFKVGIYSLNNPSEKISQLSILKGNEIVGKITTIYSGRKNIVNANINNPDHEKTIKEATQKIAKAARTEPTYHQQIGRGLNYHKH